MTTTASEVESFTRPLPLNSDSFVFEVVDANTEQPLGEVAKSSVWVWSPEGWRMDSTWTPRPFGVKDPVAEPPLDGWPTMEEAVAHLARTARPSPNARVDGIRFAPWVPGCMEVRDAKTGGLFGWVIRSRRECDRPSEGVGWVTVWEANDLSFATAFPVFATCREAAEWLATSGERAESARRGEGREPRTAPKSRARKTPPSTVKISTISRGSATVHDRETGKDLGWVCRIEWPTQLPNGEIEVKRVWEARKPHETLIVNDWGFPTFPTRREAAQHLAGAR